MQSRDAIVDALSDFKTARDAVLESGSDELSHHLREFLRQLEQNPLCREVTANLAPFDFEAWLSRETSRANGGHSRLDSIEFPDPRDEKLSAMLGLARSFGSNDPGAFSISSFGFLFRKFKHSEACDLAQSLVLHPLAEELTRRLRKVAALANPDVRELAGVPLARLPAEGETGIFLSHKWIDKQVVQRYCRVLKELGHDPWIDDEGIVAGDTLHRALDSAMDHACAAVFFVTRDFKDKEWLGHEVDLAVNRKVKQGSKFQIVTLVFGDADVPKPLTNYVYIRVEDDLEGLREILRALPIELGPARWKERAVSD